MRAARSPHFREDEDGRREGFPPPPHLPSPSPPRRGGEGWGGGGEGRGEGLRPACPSHLGRDDLVPEFGVFLLVLRPDLLLRYLAEGLDIRGIDRHPLGFEQLLRLFDSVDALGQPANSLLRRPRRLEQ